jgi:hypothetical protein
MPSHKGPIRELSDTQLLEEWDYWDNKIRDATSWGASLAAADEFRRACEGEIRRRGIARKGAAS